jgi:hypothetical protein
MADRYHPDLLHRRSAIADAITIADTIAIANGITIADSIAIADASADRNPDSNATLCKSNDNIESGLRERIGVMDRVQQLFGWDTPRAGHLDR